MKAILVIDMPSCCHTCPLEHYGLCMGTLERKTIVNDSTMPNYCPLKLMPSRKENSIVYQGEVNMDIPIDFLEKIHNQGYNYCIHEILGDEE